MAKGPGFFCFVPYKVDIIPFSNHIMNPGTLSFIFIFVHKIYEKLLFGLILGAIIEFFWR